MIKCKFLFIFTVLIFLSLALFYSETTHAISWTPEPYSGPYSYLQENILYAYVGDGLERRWDVNIEGNHYDIYLCAAGA